MKYTTLLFDNDDTLMDFAAAERQGIVRAFEENGVDYDDDLIASYSAINASLWKRLERGEIKREQIFTERFRLLKKKHSLSFSVEKIAADYMKGLELGHFLMPDALDVITALCDKYELYIVTNGHAHTQHRRIDDAGIRKHFRGVFVSEETGYQKPHTGYFNYVFEHINEKDKSKILLIGDSQSSDIKGGIDAGIDTCWVNLRGDSAILHPTYEIGSIKEILNIV